MARSDMEVDHQLGLSARQSHHDPNSPESSSQPSLNIVAIEISSVSGHGSSTSIGTGQHCSSSPNPIYHV